MKKIFTRLLVIAICFVTVFTFSGCTPDWSGFSASTETIVSNSGIAVKHDGYLYFVDIQKLSKILSLIKMLQNFNEFYSKSKNKNITLWLNNNGLVSLELLDEIKLYKIKPQGYNKFDAICQFFSTTNSYTNIDIAIKDKNGKIYE